MRNGTAALIRLVALNYGINVQDVQAAADNDVEAAREILLALADIGYVPAVGIDLLVREGYTERGIKKEAM